MSTTTPAARTAPAGLAARLPQRLTKATMALAVASLASEIGIIVTGGAVRLTGSGLGCPTWPKCSPESLTNTPEMGIHGYIEFGNRTLTFVLVVIAAAMFLSLWNLRGTHRSPFWLSVGLLAGIPAQALVGGVVVLTHLNPWWVAGHFIVSSIMVAVATLLVVRIAAERRAGRAGAAEQQPQQRPHERHEHDDRHPRRLRQAAHLAGGGQQRLEQRVEGQAREDDRGGDDEAAHPSSLGAGWAVGGRGVLPRRMDRCASSSTVWSAWSSSSPCGRCSTT